MGGLEAHGKEVDYFVMDPWKYTKGHMHAITISFKNKYNYIKFKDL